MYFLACSCLFYLFTIDLFGSDLRPVLLLLLAVSDQVMGYALCDLSLIMG